MIDEQTATATTGAARAEARRAEKAQREQRVRWKVHTAAAAYLKALDRAEAAQNALREALSDGWDEGVSDTKLSEYVSEVIEPGTKRLGRAVPTAPMGVRRLTGRAGPR